MRSLNAALRHFVPLLLIAAVMAVVAAAEALGCPNCKDAVNTSDPEGLNVARGYFYSILLMLAMPFTLVGSFGAYVWREMRRQKAAAADGETREHSAP
jgi:heme/copper-type cytochrome/quinol oxidase subunit 2